MTKDQVNLILRLEHEFRMTNTAWGRTASDLIAERLGITPGEALTRLNTAREIARSGTDICPTCNGTGRVSV